MLAATAVILALLAMIAVPAAGLAQTGSVTGRVVDASNSQPLAGVLVGVVGRTGSAARTVLFPVTV